MPTLAARCDTAGRYVSDIQNDARLAVDHAVPCRACSAHAVCTARGRFGGRGSGARCARDGASAAGMRMKDDVRLSRRAARRAVRRCRPPCAPARSRSGPLRPRARAAHPARVRTSRDRPHARVGAGRHRAHSLPVRRAFDSSGLVPHTRALASGASRGGPPHPVSAPPPRRPRCARTSVALAHPLILAPRLQMWTACRSASCATAPTPLPRRWRVGGPKTSASAHSATSACGARHPSTWPCCPRP